MFHIGKICLTFAFVYDKIQYARYSKKLPAHGVVFFKKIYIDRARFRNEPR